MFTCQRAGIETEVLRMFWSWEEGDFDILDIHIYSINYPQKNYVIISYV